MLTELSTYKFLKHIKIAIILLFTISTSYAYNFDGDNYLSNTISVIYDDDSLVKQNKKSEFDLEKKAIYNAEDSIVVDKDKNMAYLYHNAFVEYDGITLKAEYIELDFNNDLIYAVGRPDSTGKIIGNPVFKDGGEEYEAGEIRYNIKTKKGIISEVTSKEGEMLVHMDKGKKMDDNTTYVESGHFTTCDADHPHYRIKFRKGKVIPNDKIVTGPIYIEVEDIPIPLFLPFGILPNTTSRQNGLIFPSYAYTAYKGYGLTNLGYYWGLGDHADLAINGDIYTKGGWSLKTNTRYNFRYKGSGAVELSYAKNKTGETDTRFYDESNSYFIKWSHRQDPKANPNGNFSANVNFGTTNHNKLNSTNSQDYLTNTFSSSVSYSTKIGNGNNLNVAFNHNQNSRTGIVNLTLPKVSFSIPRKNPFARKVSVGKKKWYEKITLDYSLSSENRLRVIDSLLKTSTFNDFEKAIEQRIPLKYNTSFGTFRWNTSVNASERWYFQSLERYYTDTLYKGEDTILPYLHTDTFKGFNAVHDFSVSSGINTTIYGMYNFKFGPVKAMRHVLRPNLSFSYRPDFGRKPFNYYKEYTNSEGDIIRYSIYEGAMYGSPSDGKSGSVNLAFSNNIEIKVKVKNDTIFELKKIKLVDDLRISTSYNMAANEFALAPLRLSGRSSVLNGVKITYDAVWDFYDIDSTGKRINEFIWENNKRILRRNSGKWRFDFSYNINSQTFSQKRKDKFEKRKNANPDLDMDFRETDFKNKWNLDFGFNFSRVSTFNTKTRIYKDEIIKTLSLSGDINITKNWKFGCRTGWDFETNELSYTDVNIYRDLHCWELMFNWRPIGFNRGYNLVIRMKSPMLRDVKYERRRDWRDY